MKFSVAVALVIAFLATPLVCLAVPCEVAKHAHDCCPKSSGLVACPYDVLDTAKVSVVPVDAVSAAIRSAALPGPAPLPNLAPFAPIHFAADRRDLHIRIHVLLI